MEKLDIISQEVHLTVNHGQDRYQTIFGGIITLLALGTIFGISIYFLYDFLAKNQMNLSSTKVLSEDTIIPLQDVPLMIRLAGSDSSAYDNPGRLYKIHFQIWYLTPDPNQPKAFIQDFMDIEMKQCDLTKHFGEYKDLFHDFTDVGTFFCPDQRTDNHSLVGMYGNAKQFKYYHIQIAYCTNTTDDMNCAPFEEIQSQLELTYVETRTVDYVIANNETNPNIAYVHSTRAPLSIRMHKRTWLYYNMIDYYTDNGFMMKSNTRLQFFQVVNQLSELDFRDVSLTIDNVTGAFGSITITGLNYIQAYYRSYEKIQSLIANVGGIIKAAFTLAFLINYIPSKRSNTLYLTTSTPPNLQSHKVNLISKNSTNSSHHHITTQTGTTINNFVHSPSKKLSNSKIQQEPLVPKKMKVPLTFYFLPLQWIKKTKFITAYLKGSEKLNDLLDITTLIHIIGKCDSMQEAIVKKSKENINKDTSPNVNSLLKRNNGNFKTDFTSMAQLA